MIETNPSRRRTITATKSLLIVGATLLVLLAAVLAASLRSDVTEKTPAEVRVELAASTGSPVVVAGDTTERSELLAALHIDPPTRQADGWHFPGRAMNPLPVTMTNVVAHLQFPGNVVVTKEVASTLAPRESVDFEIVVDRTGIAGWTARIDFRYVDPTRGR